MELPDNGAGVGRGGGEATERPKKYLSSALAKKSKQARFILKMSYANFSTFILSLIPKFAWLVPAGQAFPATLSGPCPQHTSSVPHCLSKYCLVHSTLLCLGLS